MGGVEDAFLKSYVEEISKHGSVRGIQQPRKEVLKDVHSEKEDALFTGGTALRDFFGSTRF